MSLETHGPYCPLGVCHLFKSKNNFQEIFKFYFVFEILNFKKKTSLKVHAGKKNRPHLLIHHLSIKVIFTSSQKGLIVHFCSLLKAFLYFIYYRLKQMLNIDNFNHI